jgi:hypothetical protein
MRRVYAPVVALLPLAAIAAIAACDVAAVPAATSGAAVSSKGAPKQTATTLGCTSGPSTLTPSDPTLFPSCACKAGGKARCVPLEKMPSALSQRLEKCDDNDGACVPDTVVASGVKAVAKCVDQGQEGRCLSMCVPLVAKYATSYLTRGDGDVCPADERCVPCSNPLDGTSTGVCDIGEEHSCQDAVDGGVGIALAPGEPVTCPFSGTPADPTRFPTCDGTGRCVDARLIQDPRIASRLGSCPGGLCVPEVYVKEKGSHLPTACTSLAGIEGRCFSLVFTDVAAESDFLHQDACAQDERCVPCFNPATGAPSGACSTVSCDAPKTAPPALKDCCRMNGQPRGKCVPRTDIPGQFQSRLSPHECDGATELCAPTDDLDPTVPPASCSTVTGRGVCVSDCVELGLFGDLFLDQDSCRSDQTCVPCVDPTTGQPTGAPGC